MQNGRQRCRNGRQEVCQKQICGHILSFIFLSAMKIHFGYNLSCIFLSTILLCLLLGLFVKTTPVAVFYPFVDAYVYLDTSKMVAKMATKMPVQKILLIHLVGVVCLRILIFVSISRFMVPG
jgi:hypothetical protein